MSGYNRPAMKPAEIKTAITNLIGIPPIREIAKGKNEVVIIFDDMTRVTRVAEIVPFVLEELAEAGIPDNRIRFIAALGCHGAMDRLDFIKKLGEKTLARFPVYNHNAFGNCTYVGTTKTYRTEVYINEEVMKCDLKIAIGSVVPHRMRGFGGFGGGGSGGSAAVFGPMVETGDFLVSITQEPQNQEMYTFQIFAVDLAGNVTVTAPDTLYYSKEFENPVADSFAVTVSGDSVIAGQALKVTLTAIDTAKSNAAGANRVAVAYPETVGKRALIRVDAGEQDTSGVRFWGTGVTDNGDGTATFEFVPWYTQQGDYSLVFATTDGEFVDTAIFQLTVLDIGNQVPSAHLTQHTQIRKARRANPVAIWVG